MTWEFVTIQILGNLVYLVYERQINFWEIAEEYLNARIEL